MNFRILIVFLFCLTGLPSITLALNLDLANLSEIKLSQPAGLADKTLGTQLLLTESYAVVAAQEEATVESGSVYIYDITRQWRLIAEVNSPHEDDNFGFRLAMQNDLLIVTADFDDSEENNSGAVYIFNRTSTIGLDQWQLQQTIKAPEPQANARFGSAVLIHDTILYIGAMGQNQGIVYLYQQDPATGDWLLIDNIISEDAQALMFGADIAIDEDTLIIGAPHTNANNEFEAPPIADIERVEQQIAENQASRRSFAIQRPPVPVSIARFAISKGDVFDPGIESGALFIYKKISGDWVYDQRLGSSIRETGDHLGEQIDIDGINIFASVSDKDVFDDLRAGAVFVYKNIQGTWAEDIALIADVPNIGGAFGSSFSQLNSHILVGGKKTHFDGFNSGQSFIFVDQENPSWLIQHMQTNADIKAHDQYGMAVALTENHYLSSSKSGVYAFQNQAVAQNLSRFYADSNVLHLETVDAENLGILNARFQLSQQGRDLILTLETSSIDKKASQADAFFTAANGRLEIPHLAYYNAAANPIYYHVTLQWQPAPDQIQFKLLSIEAAN